jgi:outer membrane protein assembly complex protein YaeT
VKVNLAATRASAAPNLLPLAGMLKAQLQPGLISGSTESLAVLGGNIRGAFSLKSFREIEGEFRGEAANVDGLISQVSRFLGGSADPMEDMRVTGPIQFSASASGKLVRPSVVLSAEAPALTAGIFKHLSATADATLEGTHIAFQSKLSLPHNSTVQARGALEFGGRDPMLNLYAYGSRIRAESIPAMLDSDIPVTGELQAELQLNGAPDDLAGTLSASGEKLSLYREPLGHLDLAVRLADKQLQSTQLMLLRDAQNPDSDRVDASFIYSLDSEQFKFEAQGDALRLEQWTLPDGSPIEGAVNLTASGAGTFDAPSIQMKLETQDLRMKEISLGPIKLDASLQNDRISLDASVPRFNITSTAHVVTESPYVFDAKMRMDHADLAPLGLKVANGQALTGSIDADLQGSGNLKNPEQTEAAARIRTLQVKSGDEEVHTRDPIVVTYRNNMLEIPAAALVSKNSTIEVAGRLPVREPARSGAAASDAAINLTGQIDLSQATGFLSSIQGFAATGLLNLKLYLAGTLKKLSGNGTLTLDGGTVSYSGIQTPLTGINLRASIHGDSLTLQQADASWGQGKIALSGEFPFGLLPKKISERIPRKEGPARFNLDLTDIRPEISGALPPGMSGLISMHASGEASALELRALTARLDFRDLEFKMNDIALGQTQPSAILVRDGLATVSKVAFSGTETILELSGSAGLLPDSPINLHLTGKINAALLTFRNRDLKAEGKLKVALVASGNRKSLSMAGLAEATGGRFTLRDPRVVADGLSVRLTLDPKQITVREFKGNLNGGPMSVTGTMGYRRDALSNLNLKATVQDFFFNFPEGLKSSSSGDLSIISNEDLIEIGGTIRIQESSFRESFDVRGRLMSYLKSQQIIETDQEPDLFFDRIRLNIAVRTETPLLVQNNEARVEGTASLRLIGPFQEPSVLGRITLNDGGEITLNQRTYYISRGVINFTNQTRIEPQIDIQAQTQVRTQDGNYDITLRLTGTPDKLSTTLTSDSTFSESDIISLLLTGQTRGKTRGQEMQIARTQALSLIAGQAGEELTSEARRALRLSTFRIDPGQIASESDSGARLTLGQDITNRLSLAYSMNLTNGGDQIWAAQYELVRRFTTQATKQQDNTYRFEFNHSLQLGGPKSTRRTARTPSRKFEIGAIRLEGAEPFPEKELLNTFRVRTGQKYDFPKIQKGLDRLNEFYFSQRRLEAAVRMQRETVESAVNLNLNIDPGPVVSFQYEGMALPAGVKEDVEKAWKSGVFDIERLEDAIRAIRGPLLRSGYLQAEVTNAVATENEQKTVRFLIAPGARFSAVPIVFPGASKLSAQELSGALEQAGLAMDVYADPQKVVDFLNRYYRDRGYLQARIQAPSPQLDPLKGTGQVSVKIEEGSLFLIGDLEFKGNHAFGYDELWSAIPTSTGSSYNPGALRDSIKALEALYHRKGFNDVSMTYRVLQNSADARANLIFSIVERKQSFIRDLVIEGNLGTSRDFVERQLDFRVGDILDQARIDESRRRLYNTAVYSTVDFQTEDLPEAGADAKTKDVRVKLRVREIRPYRLQYGLFYDTERGIGGILEAENRNFLGQASDLGLKLRYDSDLKEGRIFFYQPFVTKIHIKTDASAFAQRETRTAFSATRIGFSVFQERSLPRGFRLDYGYRYDHVRWNGLPPDPTIFQASVPVARVIATLTRDSRDNVLDATRGEFSSHSFEFGPRFLGSEIGFTRYSGQYFRYVPLNRFFARPAKDNAKKTAPSRLVYAGALRLGLTSAFGGSTIISPERFFAGGGTTMRGFEQDRLGPLETLSDGTVRPFGGEALLLFNNELRFPIFGMLHGAGFLDIGNVYPKISDFNFNVRKSAGLGLRLKIKFIPLRFDYGFKLDRKPGERGSAYFFSIGQSF